MCGLQTDGRAPGPAAEAPGDLLDMQMLRPHAGQSDAHSFGNQFALETHFLIHNMTVISVLNPGLF